MSSKHINFLMRVIEIIVSQGTPETREGCGGVDMGVVLHYQGYVDHNGSVYNVRYYTGRYEGPPCIELYDVDKSIRAYVFDGTEKTPISAAMFSSFDKTFTKTKPEAGEPK